MSQSQRKFQNHEMKALEVFSHHDVSHSDVSDQDVSPPDILDRTFAPTFWTWTLNPLTFWTMKFLPLIFWTWTFRLWHFGPGISPPDLDVSLPDFSDQIVSPLDIFGPGRFAPCLFGPGCFALDILDLDVLPPEILDQDVSPPDLLDLNVSHPGRFATRRFEPGHFVLDVSDQDVSPLNILYHHVTFPDNCFIIQNICFSWKFCHLGEFTSNFSWHCFTIHVTLWHYVRDYATLLEVTLASMRY